MNRAMIGKTGLIGFFSLIGLFSSFASENPYFKIRVVDDATGRGVPLVELKTTNEIGYYTDSNGIVAFYEPGLMGIDVFFTLTSHGYSYPADGFGMRGIRLHTGEGQEAVIRIQRDNLAERLYRITGQGIYRDSVLTGEPVPVQHPVLNGQVMGQDSALAVPYNGKLYWFWGDTGRPQYPLGNFMVSGATSDLPASGGLSPEQGVNLHYFVNREGFCKSLCPIKKNGLVWIDGLVTVPDPTGRERLVAYYSHRKSLEVMLEHGLVLFDDERQEFKKWVEFDFNKTWPCPHGHPIRVKEGEKEYFYFTSPFPTVRVQADLAHLRDQSQYQAFTCLQQNTRYQGKNSKLDMEQGRLHYSWKTDTDPIGPSQEQELIQAGILQKDNARFLPNDAQSGRSVVLHSGSVNWNEYPKKWIMIAVEIGGTSFLGEVWYAESQELTGPWQEAKKIVTHDRYSFYNPVHHPFFDQQNGRIIYFEGTYSKTFSDSPIATPRYDYNQIMYRLDVKHVIHRD